MAKRKDAFAVALTVRGFVRAVGPFRNVEDARLFGTPALKMGADGRCVAVVKAASKIAAEDAAAEAWSERRECGECGLGTQPERDERGVYLDCIAHGPCDTVRRGAISGGGEDPPEADGVRYFPVGFGFQRH